MRLDGHFLICFIFVIILYGRTTFSQNYCSDQNPLIQNCSTITSGALGNIFMLNTTFHYAEKSFQVFPTPGKIAFQDEYAFREDVPTTKDVLFYCYTVDGLTRLESCEDLLFNFTDNGTLSYNIAGDGPFCVWMQTVMGVHCNTTNNLCLCRLVNLTGIPMITPSQTGVLIDVDLLATVPSMGFVNLTFNSTRFITNTPGRKRFVSSVSLNPLDLINKTGSEVVYMSMPTDNSLTVTFGTAGLHSVMIQKGSYTNLTVVPFGVNIFTTTLPDDVIRYSGVMTVTAYNNVGIISVQTYNLIGVTSCRVYDCIICWSVVNSFSCLPTYAQAFLVTILILAIMIIWCLMPGFFAGLGVAFWYIFCKPFQKFYAFIRYVNTAPVVNNITKNVTKNVSRMKQGMTPKGDVDLEGRVVDTVADKVTKRMGPSIYIPTVSTIILYGLLILPLAFAQTCSDSLFLTAQNHVCVTNGTAQSCSFQLTSLITLEGLGDELCITILNPDDNSTVGTLTATYISSFDTVSLTTQYYTSNWTGVSQSSKRCDGAGACNEGECGLVNTLQVRDADGELTDWWVINFPGAVQCTSSCGCAGCGCFYCDDACLYSGYAIVPNGEVLQVLTLNTRIRSPTLRLSLTLQDGTTSTTSISIVGVTTQFNMFTVQLLGTLVGDLSQFPVDYRNIIISSTSVSIGPAATINQPKAGMVGDIQANTPSGLATAAINAFAFDKQVVTAVTYDQNHAYYQFQNGGALGINYAPYLTMPAFVAGNYWFYDSGTIYAQVTNPGALLFTLNTATPVSYTKTVNIVCPVVTLVSANGCYSCNNGSHVIVTATSICAPGFVTLVSDDPSVTVLTNRLYLAFSNSNYTITILTPNQYNNFNLIFIGTSTNATLNLNFVANYTGLVNPNITGTNPGDMVANPSVSNGIWDSFSNFFTSTIPGFFDSIAFGSAPWWYYLVFAILILIALVIVSIMFYPALKSYTSFMRTVMKAAKHRRPYAKQA